MNTFPYSRANTTQWTAEDLAPAPTNMLGDELYMSDAALLRQSLLGELSQPSSSEQIDTLQSLSSESMYPFSRCTSQDFEQLDASWAWLQQDDEDVPIDTRQHAKERRRAQNRSAQRAYRQRKEQAIKDAEKVIETLKSQLAKEEKQNQELRKVLGSFKHQLQQYKMFRGSMQGNSPQ